MNILVKVIRDDDGVLTNKECWHLNDPCSDGVWCCVLAKCTVRERVQ